MPMNSRIRSVLLLAGATGAAFTSPAQRPGVIPQNAAAPHLVGVGDPLRKPLLDALRPTVERDLGQPVRLMVDRVRHQRGWAFIVARPRTPGGKAIDFGKTRHEERQAAGILDGDTIYALLRWEGGRWSVRDYVIGPTDVTYASWPDDYGAPATLFGLPH